jgi:RNA methyltransferase, TrmH family
MQEIITSIDNKNIKLIKLLSSHSKFRKKYGLFVIEGLKNIEDNIAHNKENIFLVAVSDLNQEYVQDAPLFRGQSFEIIIVEHSILNKISTLKSPDGFLAICKPKQWDIEKKLLDFKKIAILDQVQNPANIGAIIRNAVAFKVDAIFYTEGSADIYHPEAIRAMAGNCFQIPFVELKQETLTQLTDCGFSLFYLDAKAKQTLDKVIMPEKIAFVLGSEGKGIHSEILENASHTKVRIKTTENIDSLNVAVTSGIVFYAC